MPTDTRGLEYTEHQGRRYYTSQDAAKYVGMTDTGFRRKRDKMRIENGVDVPIIILPVSRQKRFIDKRILDVFNKPIRVGQEPEQIEALRKVVDEVNNEKW